METGKVLLTDDALFWRRWNNATMVQMFLNQLLMESKEVAETSVNFHLIASEVWYVCLKVTHGTNVQTNQLPVEYPQSRPCIKVTNFLNRNLNLA